MDCNFSFFGNIQTLKNLKYVGGELHFGAPLKSLGVLEEIKGDFRPTTNDLEDLGRLSKVGGTVDLRGMINIIDLSPLKEIGGNLNLVKSLKDQYDLSKLRVKGRILYWNIAPEYYIIENKLKKSRTPPPWENKGPYEFENHLVTPNREQMEFYTYFKDSFFKEVYVDVGGMRNYIRYFIYEILRKYDSDHDFESLVEQFGLLKEYYPNLSHDCENIEVEVGRKLKIDKYQEVVLPHEEWDKWKQFIKKTVGDNPQRITSEGTNDQLIDILEIGFTNGYLTSFGKENEESIFKILVDLIRDDEQRLNFPFSFHFFDKDKYYKTKSANGVFNPLLYKDLFDSIEDFEANMKEHYLRNQGVPEKNILHPVYVPTIVEFAIKTRMKQLIMEAENRLREEQGLPLIGEGWISETDLFYKIKSAFPEHEIIHHGKPKWLGSLHFDIYFPNLNIAIEYQGAQHFQEVEIFGGKEGLIQAKENDRKKREKCLNNQCTLIEVLPDYVFESVKAKINSAIRM